MAVRQNMPLLIELPEYKTPNAHTIAIYVWEKVKDYLSKAGTVIFIASIIMWAVMNLGPHGFVSDISESFGSIIGKALVPVLAPAGLGYWQIAVALYLRYRRQRGGGLKLQCPLWHCQYHDSVGNGQHGGRPWLHGIRSGERLCADGLLPPLCSMHGDAWNDSPGSRKDKHYCCILRVSACHCLDFRCDLLSDRNDV